MQSFLQIHKDFSNEMMTIIIVIIIEGGQGGLLLMRELVRFHFGVFEEVIVIFLIIQTSASNYISIFIFVFRCVFANHRHDYHHGQVSGFAGDRIYKSQYRIGSETVTTVGCSPAARPSALQFCRWW